LLDGFIILLGPTNRCTLDREIEARPCYQAQQISMTENNSLFLIRQKAYRLRNRVSQKEAIERHLILVKGKRTYVIFN